MIPAILILTHMLAVILGVVYYRNSYPQFQDMSRTEILKVTQIIENLKWAHVNEYNTLITEWSKMLEHVELNMSNVSVPLHSIITQVRTV